MSMKLIIIYLPQLSNFLCFGYCICKFTKHYQLQKCTRQTQFHVWWRSRSKMPFLNMPQLKPNKFFISINFDFASISSVQNTIIFFYRVQIWHFLTGVKPPHQKKAKLSKTDAWYKKEKRKQEPQQTWKDKQPTLQFTPDGTMICSYSVDTKKIFKSKLNL